MTTQPNRFTQCPYCGAGPFRALGKHTYEKHGITAEAARSRLGVTGTQWHALNQAGKAAEEDA